MDIASSADDLVLRASNRQLTSPGYLAVYATSFFRSTASSDEEEAGEASSQGSLTNLKAGLPIKAFPASSVINVTDTP